jgi:hypothetical protein
MTFALQYVRSLQSDTVSSEKRGRERSVSTPEKFSGSKRVLVLYICILKIRPGQRGSMDLTSALSAGD